MHILDRRSQLGTPYTDADSSLPPTATDHVSHSASVVSSAPRYSTWQISSVVISVFALFERPIKSVTALVSCLKIMGRKSKMFYQPSWSICSIDCFSGSVTAVDQMCLCVSECPNNNFETKMTFDQACWFTMTLPRLGHVRRSRS